METVFSSLLIAIVVSWLTTQFALRRFYRERWWEKKYNTYEAIFNALHNMSQGFDAERYVLNDTLLGEKDARAEHLQNNFEDGRDEIRRIIALGEFILSRESVTELQKILVAPIPKAPGIEAYVESIVTWGTAIDNCLARLRVLAANDLNPTFYEQLCHFSAFRPRH